ncbi:WD repeat-containing protein 75 [Alligator mississippiensis]|uniref:WD repeat-containing protein 75 n=1 Tax=Alligator mississippiensis TaxID=8496 RepID=A0A151NA83_ALLMI|nr:WD repeat-containing protein 75 [Alligator mississippiensis]KYO33720.1 WD repeat-containing protein 75 [Alligator mississippiensis]
MVAQEQFRVVRCGGSKLNGSRAAFSADAKYLLCASGDYVKVYSTATEECIHILQGHTNLVTGIQLNPQNHLQLYSCSLDGTIKLWDFTDGILIKTFVVGYKIFAFYSLAGSDDSGFVIIPKNNEEASDSFQLVLVRLTKAPGQEVETKELSLILDDIDHSPKCTAFGREGEYVASVRGLHLSVYFFKKKMTHRFPLSARTVKGANNYFTCVACHPKEDCIASGHKDGKIRLWRNFTHNKEYTFSAMHWHHNAVMDLAFTVEGTNLLSGGLESVLVQWRDGSESKKEFLPRLGSTIEHISVSPDGTLCCTSHAENKITIIQSNLRVSAVIQGLVKGSSVKTGLVVDPRTKALVLNGKPGHLQFFCLQSDKQLYNLDIVQQEYIHQAGLSQTDLVKAAFSAQGNWLATVEQRQEKESDLELQMKLWAYDEQMQSFKLNTRINMPHEDHLTALCFRDTDGVEDGIPTLVTAAKDGRFKVWVFVDESDTDKQSVGWICDFVGSYHNYQANNCCFSEDGSLLSVSFEEIVTVWDSETWDLKCTFCHPPGKIWSLCFGRLSCSKYLLGTTDHGFLCCWNLLSCALEWSAQLGVIVLQPDPLSENIAAVSCISEDSDLFVFRPNEPRPLCIQRKVCRGKVQCAVFIPRNVPETVGSEKYQWLSRSQLYFLTAMQELMTFSTKSPEMRLTPSSKQLAVEESLPMTPFYLLLGKHREQQQLKKDADIGKAVVHSHSAQSSPAVKELLHTPAHVLPSAAFLCSIFINTLLISKENKSNGEVADEVEMESEKAEDESDEDIDHTAIEEDPKLTELWGEMTPKLSKSQEKELRKIRKTDYSWISAL